MKPLSVSELKSHLSEHLREVRAGGEVVVNERGRPIARIVPFLQRGDSAGSLLPLVAAGLVRPATAPLEPADLDPSLAAKDPDARLRAVVAQDREDRA
ncbi:MAG: type II toxin-antitoxin system prevent-host-death family antitoxin [Pseudomonadota bacterium]